jgi:peptidoglycan/xylan/chitin deacetylase (PgdA/CDA1 family)
MKRVISRVRKWFRVILTHPLVVVPVIVAVGLFAWNRYLITSRNFVVASDNLLPSGNFAQYDHGGVPVNWQLTKNGLLHVDLTHSTGHVLGDSFLLHVSDYQNGDAQFSSPAVMLGQGKKYIFKGFYQSTISFDLLARYTYDDGSTQLQLVRTYAASGSTWTTASDAFVAPSSVQSVQFIYRLSSNGVLTLNNNFLEADASLAIPGASTALGSDLFQDANFGSFNNGISKFWLVEHTGNNQVKTSLVGTATNPYLHVSMAQYKDGAVSWRQQPIPVAAGQYFTFSVSYMSDTRADIVVEYQMSDHTYQFDTVATLNPASEWTTATVHFEIPADVVTMSPSLVLHQNGSLSARDYSLYNVTHPGTISWKQPLISLAFDGGWQSQYANALPALKKYGYKGTFYVNVATLGTNDVVGTSELLQLKRQGNELASQGYSYLDLTTIDNAGITTQLASSRSNLGKMLSQKISDFAAPYGNIDAQVVPLLRGYYMSNRGTTNGINTKQDFDPYNLKVLYIGGDTPLSVVQKAINQAQAYNGWLILVYNQIPNLKSFQLGNTTSISNAELNQQLAAIQHSGVRVETVAQALNQLAGQ